MGLYPAQLQLSLQGCVRWLRVVCWAVIGYSLALVFAPATMIQLFNWLFGSSWFTTVGLNQPAHDYIELVFSILGAVIVGWMVLMLFVLKWFAEGQLEAWLALVVSISFWFVLDSGVSLWLGVWQHALFNVLFLVLFAIPLLASRVHFQTAFRGSKPTTIKHDQTT